LIDIRSVSLRQVTAEDEPFLCAVYCSTRLDEMAVTGWPEAQQRSFLEAQHRAQHQHYRTHYHDTDYSITLVDGEPAGRLYVGRWDDELRIVDIALLPQYRGQGIGTRLIEDLISEAGSRNLPVRIHVEIFNPAHRLYERLGFAPVEDKGVYLLMEWRSS
jgi:GNAT superfamily N-acetyltransferase